MSTKLATRTLKQSAHPGVAASPGSFGETELSIPASFREPFFLFRSKRKHRMTVVTNASAIAQVLASTYAGDLDGSGVAVSEISSLATLEIRRVEGAETADFLRDGFNSLVPFDSLEDPAEQILVCINFDRTSRVVYISAVAQSSPPIREVVSGSAFDVVVARCLSFVHSFITRGFYA